MQKPDLEYLTQSLLELLKTPSPTGLTSAGMELLERELKALGLEWTRTRKGALCWSLPGKSEGKQVCFAAHMDTLGAMVKAIKPSGRLKLERMGGFDWGTVEGEYALVHRSEGEPLSATVVHVNQSVHVHGNPENLKRDKNTLELRLDAITSSAAETAELGIRIGDYVSWDSRATFISTNDKEGYVKGRHLDNKAAVAVFLALSKAVLEGKIQLEHTAHFFISNFEEVGHGASSGLPEKLDELIVVDMAAIGEGQNSSEHHVSLCHMDSSGPYSRDLSLKLRAVAGKLELDLRDDLYPWYSSDGRTAWLSGQDLPIALIGPGVDASHAYERTHTDALEGTFELMLGYLLEGMLEVQKKEIP
jgi:putative aminopeptidase FrvX